jgi:hypothetical protein
MICRDSILGGAALKGVLVLAALAAFPPTSRASVRIESKAIVLRTSSGGAMISRSPLRVQFTDARGRVVLGEAGAGRELRLAPPPAPLIPNYGPPLQRTLYAPLEFTVGTETDATQAAGTWSGDLLTSVRTGIAYRARSVRSAHPLRGGGCA